MRRCPESRRFVSSSWRRVAEIRGIPDTTDKERGMILNGQTHQQISRLKAEVYTRMGICMCISVCVYINLYLFIGIYTYIFSLVYLCTCLYVSGSVDYKSAPFFQAGPKPNWILIAGTLVTESFSGRLWIRDHDQAQRQL